MADYMAVPGNSIRLEQCCKTSFNRINAALKGRTMVDNIMNMSTLAQVITSGNIPEAIYNLTTGAFSDCEKVANQMGVIGNQAIGNCIYKEALTIHTAEGDRLHIFWTNLGRAFKVDYF
ncbi:MAG: hypothetical protein ABSF98_04035 [Bryobacteraceae bacterium]|jgi:hypothetical protein